MATFEMSGINLTCIGVQDKTEKRHVSATHLIQHVSILEQWPHFQLFEQMMYSIELKELM